MMLSSEKTTNNITNIIAIVLLAYYMLYRMPVVSYYVNTYITMLLLVALVIAFLIKLSNSKIMISMLSLLCVPAYIMFLVDFCYAKDFSILYSAWSFFLFVLPLFLGKVIVSRQYKSSRRVVIVSIILVYLITAVTTITGLSAFPNASRLLATGGEYYKTFYPYNIGGYGFIYSLVLLHPLIVGVLRKKTNIFFAIIFSCVAGFCIIKSAYTIALLLFVISLVAYLLPVSNEKKLNSGRLVLFVIIIIILMALTVPILNALSEWEVIDEQVSQKIKDVVNVLTGNEVEGIGAESRQKRYEMSFGAIAQNPILGLRIGKAVKTGGHSFILDTIAKWGIVGMSFMTIFFMQFLQFYKKITAKSVAGYYSILFLVLVVVLSALNPTFWEFELGLIAPLLLCELSEDKETKGKKPRTNNILSRVRQ